MGPALFYEDWAIEAFNTAVEGVKNASIVFHVCWGNWGGTPAYYPDETGKAGEIFDLTKRKENANAPAATRSVVVAGGSKTAVEWSGSI